jgi:hypothetical protein
LQALPVLFAIVFLFSLNYAYGIEDSYGAQSNRFTTKPIVCVIAPSENDLSEENIKSVLDEAKTSVYDWITPLQQKSTNKSKWAINYLEVYDKKSFDFSICSVIINFKNETNSKTLHNLGTHQYVDGTSYITIFYKTNECKTSISCKTNIDSLVAKIGSTLRHEFGHAIGLGHYAADKSKNREWFENPETAPSIMLPYSKGLKNEKVTDRDIDQVIQIYKDSGFVNQHLPKPRKVLPAALTQIGPQELFISDQSPNTSKFNIIRISGSFEKKNHLLETATLLIIKPDFKSEKIKIFVDKNGYFEHDLKIHSKLPKGIYYIQAQYGKDMTEKNMFELN